MPEVFRTRDVVVFKKGDANAFTVSENLVTRGWVGGQGVQWFDIGRDELAVDFSDGIPNGFMLWGSDEDSDEYTAITRNQPHYRFGVVGFGGWIFATRTFEVYTYASRLSGPLVPITYSVRDPLYFSLNGLWTNEDEWTLSGDPRAPSQLIGTVMQVPSAAINNFLTVQTRL
jgi:hypothetical protein